MDPFHSFEHVERIHPIYFQYPSEQDDDVSIALPAGWQVTSVHRESEFDVKMVGYSLKAANQHHSVHISRQLHTDAMLLKPQDYSTLRDFFQKVRTTDEEQILLQPGAPTASN